MQKKQSSPQQQHLQLAKQSLPQQSQEQKPTAIQKNEQKIELIPKQQKPLKQELLEMGFEENLVDQALKMFTTKDEIIQYVITRLDDNDQKVDMQPIDSKIVDENEEDFEDVEEEMDLKMGLGKIAAQVGHATLKAYKQMEYRADHNQLDEVSFFEWMETGQKKIVLKVPDEKELLTILNRAKSKGLNTCYIRDAGLTQIAAGSLTVGAIGPGISSELDTLTKHLKLL